MSKEIGAFKIKTYSKIEKDRMIKEGAFFMVVYDKYPVSPRVILLLLNVKLLGFCDLP
ncbi:MAG TPA: hypothetical protein QF468_04285 [Nitrospinota bacterium]|nr:hypothetical protein [Nitrospinota bacterium]